MQQTNRIELQKVNISDLQKTDNQQKAKSFFDHISVNPYKVEASQNLRFFPQPVGSPYTYTKILGVLNFQNGAVVLSNAALKKIEQMVISLRVQAKGNAQIKELLEANKVSKSFVLTPQYKALFYGATFMKTPSNEWKQESLPRLIVLPANQPGNSYGPRQIGTELIGAIQEVDETDNSPKYPNFLNTDFGNILILKKSGERLSTNYDFSITKEVPAPFTELSGLQKFDDVISYTKDEDAIKTYVNQLGTLAQYVKI
jgi:hypothetical protein